MADARTRWAAPLLLALLTIGAHAWELNGEFVYDDFPYIVENAAVQAGIGQWSRAFTELAASGNPNTGHYRPLVALTYAADVSLGLGTFGFKATQLLLHLLTVLALYRLVAGLGRAVPGTPPGTALAAAAWVAVAPFNVDAVHYLTARSSVLCGLFSVLAVGAFLRMRRARGGGAVAWYGAHLAALAAAVLSKETALAVPAVVLAADLLLLLRPAAPGTRRGPAHWWPYAPYAAGGLLAWVLMPNVHRVFHYLGGVFAEPWRVAAAVRCLAENLRLMLLPTGLSITHPIGPGLPLPAAGTLAAGAAVALVAAGAWGARRRAPLVAFGLAWYFLLIAPSTFVVLQEVLQEHRGYPASLGVGMAVGWSAAWLWRAAGRRRPLVAAGLGLAAALLVAGTVARERAWTDELTLWTRALKVHPTSARAYVRIGEYFTREGRPDLAERAIRRALALKPAWMAPVLQLADLYRDHGRPERAEAVLLDARRVFPDSPVVLGKLVRLYEAGGQTAKLASLYRDALIRWPGQAPDLHLALAGVLRRQGDLEGAQAEVRSALTARPEWPRALFEAGAVARDGGLPEAAADWFRRAVRADPHVPAYRVALGEALLGAGRSREAADVLAAAVADAPDDPDARFQLARALDAAGRPAAAREAWEAFLARAAGPDPDGHAAQARERLAAPAPAGEGGP